MSFRVRQSVFKAAVVARYFNNNSAVIFVHCISPLHQLPSEIIYHSLVAFFDIRVMLYLVLGERVSLLQALYAFFLGIVFYSARIGASVLHYLHKLGAVCETRKQRGKFKPVHFRMNEIDTVLLPESSGNIFSVLVESVASFRQGIVGR
jgi:hypothetical protein